VDFWIFLDFQFPTVFSLFHCHVIYAIHIWSCSAESNFKEILIKQKQALRIISGAQYNAHTEPLFKMQNILPINDLILFFKLEFMQQYVKVSYHSLLLVFGELLESKPRMKKIGLI
jgi:hypothetical protein